MDKNLMPTRKVNAGAAVGGLLTFASILCETQGWLKLPPYAWQGLALSLVYIAQYVTRDRD